MPRKLRLEYAGAIYHLMNRGDQREEIFRDDRDRERFLATLGQACEKTGWQVHTYCLMPNHFHLVVETPRANLQSGMHWFLGTYTARYNRRHQLSGHLFSGRYKSLLVDGSGNGYLKSVCDYVHLNPVRAKFIGPEQPLESYGWSSYPVYLRRPHRRPQWLRVDRLLGEWGVQQDDGWGRRRFARGMEQRRVLEQAQANQDWERLRQGWCWGREEFRAKLLERIGREQGRQHYGQELRESDEQKARRLIGRMLKEAGWSGSELAQRAKGHETKAQMAAQLRAQTTMTWTWIAQQLCMGHWRTAANAVRQLAKP